MKILMKNRFDYLWSFNLIISSLLFSIFNQTIAFAQFRGQDSQRFFERGNQVVEEEIQQLQRNNPVVNTSTDQLKTLADWCKNQDSLSSETQKTLQAITQALTTESCEEAAAQVPKVFSLRIINQDISDLRPISSLFNLTEIVLYQNKITDITPLASLTSLKRVVLGHNQITDLTALQSLTNIEQLFISSNGLEDIQPLSTLSKLNILHINQNKISNLEPLANLTNLEQLYARGNNISDLTSLENLTNLKELYLDNNNISNLQPLTKLVKLEELSLNSNKITDSNVAPLWNLPNLQQLYVHNNPVAKQFCPNNRDGLCFLSNR